MDEKYAIFAMVCVEGIGTATFDRLCALYGDAGKAWEQENPPLGGEALSGWHYYHQTVGEQILRQKWEHMEEEQIRFLTRTDPEYPPMFHELKDEPVGVFVRGRLPEPGAYRAAIIGARKCTPYGKACAAGLASELAEQGIWVISGMALGIDAWAQWAALDAGGPSLAILGSGIDVCYPATHERLYDRLAEAGGILSEYPPGVKALPYHFPMRNRLISAMAQTVVVVEAQARSGTLITVDHAIEQGRDVLAYPGRADDIMSEGCNRLIRQGAGICLGVEDVLYSLGVREDAIRTAVGDASDMKKQTAALTPGERKVYEVLRREPKHVEQIMTATGLDLGDLMVELWNLESKKLICETEEGTYRRL